MTTPLRYFAWLDAESFLRDRAARARDSGDIPLARDLERFVEDWVRHNEIRDQELRDLRRADQERDDD